DFEPQLRLREGRLPFSTAFPPLSYPILVCGVSPQRPGQVSRFSFGSLFALGHNQLTNLSIICYNRFPWPTTAGMFEPISSRSTRYKKPRIQEEQICHNQRRGTLLHH